MMKKEWRKWGKRIRFLRSFLLDSRQEIRLTGEVLGNRQKLGDDEYHTCERMNIMFM